MARSSMYGSIASMVPKWVFGGDYGDISNELNARDLSYENLARTEIANDQARLQLQQEQRSQELDQMLAEKFQGQRPASMKDAYISAIDAAFTVGDVDTALKYQGAVEKLDEMERRQKFEDLKGAASLAQMVDYNRVNEALPGVLSPQEASRIYSESRRRGSGGGEGQPRASDYEIVVDKRTGYKQRVLWPKAEQLQETGDYVINPSADQQLQILSDIRTRQAKEAEAANASQGGPSILDMALSMLNPTASQPTPVPRPSPTAAPQEARGDRARQGPSVGDQVQVISRNRSVKR